MAEWLANQLKGEILEISLGAEEDASVQKLSLIRHEIRRRARRKWWQVGQLDKSRWHTLEQIIDHRIEEARSTRMQALLREVHALADGDRASVALDAERLRKQSWAHLEHGELNEAQLGIVLKALDDLPSSRPERGSSA